MIIGDSPAARLEATLHRRNAMQSTTTFDLTGFRIVRNLGVVRGITVRTRSLPLTIVGAFRTLFGGRAGIFTTLCEKAREEAFELMLAHAHDIGANAVVGVRYDTGPMVGTAEVLCYGTAVVVEPAAGTS
ncbi:MAG TPA: YbjQ family protein [Xanthobacteraceae bacterium]|nr:YbjQ family protein [Xanthobacteraceae bacterium]